LDIEERYPAKPIKGSQNKVQKKYELYHDRRQSGILKTYLALLNRNSRVIATYHMKQINLLEITEEIQSETIM